MLKKMSNLKKKSNQAKTTDNNEEGVLMTIPPNKKRKKVIKIETENTKKEREEIQKQNQIKLQIKELEEKIAFERNQRNIVMSMKKAELARKEKNIEQIDDTNKKLEIEINRIQKEIDTKFNKTENKEKNKKEINNNSNNNITNNPLEKELKENDKEIENSKQIIEQYKKDINNLQKIVDKNIDVNQINNLKEEIKNVQERISNLQKEKKYLLNINEEHNKCLEHQTKLQEDINYYQTELNKLKIENKEKSKIKIEQQINDTKSNNNKYKGLSPQQIQQKKEKHIKSSLDEFWSKNKEKLLKSSLSDNIIINKEELNNKIKNNKNYLLYNKKKKYAEGIKDFNLDINNNNALPVLPLFNSNEKKILLNVLPEEEIQKYEKRYECADIEKKNLQRKYAFETRKLFQENKDIKNKFELNTKQIKENEEKNSLLTMQIEEKEKEYEELKNKMNNMIKEMEEKNKKIKEWDEENQIMAKRLQEIRAKYEEVDKEEEEDEGEGKGDEEEEEEEVDEETK